MSKLTDGFGNRVHEVGSGYWQYDPRDVDELLAHTRQLEAMLKKHEWVDYDGTDYCVECVGLKHYGNPKGHAPDCELAKLLE